MKNLTPQNNSEKQQWKLLYDGECTYCTKFAELVKKFDNSNYIHTLSLQEHYLENKNISLDELLADVHLLGNNNEVLTGGNAVNKIISIIPQAKPGRWMIESHWGKKGTELLYRTVKKFRRCSSCNK